MQRAGAIESNRQAVPGRGAVRSAPRPTPLTVVSGALGGTDLHSVAATVAEALGRPVMIAIPVLGETIVAPPGALPAEQWPEVSRFVASVTRGETAETPRDIAEAVPVRIGEKLVGIAAAGFATQSPVDLGEQRAWLEATAAAASVAALIRGTQHAPPEDAQASLLWELASGPPRDLPGLLVRARRLGVELNTGAVALCAQRGADADADVDVDVETLVPSALATEHGVLLAETAAGRLLGLAPSRAGHDAAAIAAHLRGLGLEVAVSAPRRDPGTLHEALREAELLLELAHTPGVPAAGPDETYRLLIGVLLRDPDDLAQLRDSTIAALTDYDERHDSDLLTTLQAFLAHDGSTTETAEALQLHRHTVGYRLSRVHEVSGLSPYESDGRERLSLGLKAHQIINAAEQRGSSFRR